MHSNRGGSTANRILSVLIVMGVGWLCHGVPTAFSAHISLLTHPDHLAVYSPIVFDARSEGEENLAGVRWKFDDGTIVHGPLAEHRFKDPGPHYVELETIDYTGQRTYDLVELPLDPEPLGVDLRVSGIQVSDPLPTGNNDGVLAPGERGTIRVFVTNIGSKPAREVRASLVLTPDVRAELPLSYRVQSLSFSEVPPFSQIPSSNSLVFSLPHDFEPPHGLWFYLLVEDKEKHRSLGALTIPLGDKESNVYSVPLGIEGTVSPQFRESTLYFRSPATDLLRVGLTGMSTLDPVIWLSTPDGRRLYDEDSGDGNGALLVISDAQEGLYRLEIGGESGSVGAFVATADTGWVPFGHEQSNIVIGEDRVGMIRTADETVVYAFYAEANEEIKALVSGETGTFDPYFILRGPDGAEIASDDDSGPGNDASVVVPYAPVSGMYTLVVKTTPKWRTTGQFRLYLIDERYETNEISIGQTLTGFVQNMGHRISYHFSNPHRRLLVFTLDDFDSSPTEFEMFNPYLQLFDSEGEPVAVDDDTGSGDDAILMTRLTEGFVEVSGGPYETTGPYRLHVERDPKSIPDLRTGTTTALIRRGKTDIYRAYIEEDSTVHIEVSRIDGDLEPTVRVLAPNGRRLVQVGPDTFHEPSSVRTFLIAPQTGQYKIHVWGTGKSSGLASITLEVID